MVLISHRYKFIYIQTKKTASTSVSAFFERYCLPENEEVTHKAESVSHSYEGESGFIGSRSEDSDFRGYRCRKCRNYWITVMPGYFVNKEITYNHNCIKNSEIETQHTTLYQITMLPNYKISDEVVKSFYKFTTVRNPWDVQVSYFFYALQPQNINPSGNYDSNSTYDYFSHETHRIETISFADFIRKNLIVNSNIYSLNNKPGCDFYIRYEHLEEDIKKVCETLKLTYDITNLQKFRSSQRKKKDYRSMYTDELRDIVAQKCATEIAMFGYTF